MWFIFFIKLRGELAHESCAGGNSYCYCDYYVFYLVLAGDNEPFRVAPSAFNGYYRYPVSGGSAFTAEFFF